MIMMMMMIIVIILEPLTRCNAAVRSLEFKRVLLVHLAKHKSLISEESSVL